jgi:hypothetical protein
MCSGTPDDLLSAPDHPGWWDGSSVNRKRSAPAAGIGGSYSIAVAAGGQPNASVRSRRASAAAGESPLFVPGLFFTAGERDGCLQVGGIELDCVGLGIQALRTDRRDAGSRTASLPLGLSDTRLPGLDQRARSFLDPEIHLRAKGTSRNGARATTAVAITSSLRSGLSQPVAAAAGPDLSTCGRRRRRAVSGQRDGHLTDLPVE